MVLGIDPEPRLVMQQAFPGIPAQEAEALIASGALCDYEPGVVLCTEGAVEDTFYIVLAGEVRVTKVINDEEVRLLKHLYPGDFFGEMALIHKAPRAATVITVQPTQVLEIRQAEFERILHSSSSMSMAMVREVSRRLRENDEMAILSLRSKAGELTIAYQQLAEQEFARREFLTTIAHELRTPLTAANGFLQLAQRGGISEPERQAALDVVARNLQQITTLVNDLLFLQEVDLIFSEFQPIDLSGLLQNVAMRSIPHANRRQIKFGLNLPPGLPKIHGDARTLERAFDALLDNAIKYSQSGGIVELTAGAAHPNSDKTSLSRLWVQVRDQGVGIPPTALPHIFDRFFHLDNLEGQLYGGVGLGLSIARQVIEQHGGEIQVESQPGQGSTFTVWLNAAPA